MQGGPCEMMASAGGDVKQVHRHGNCEARKPMTNPAQTPILTVGDLKAELSRWRDDSPVIFRSPLKEQEFRFYRFQSGEGNSLVLELNEYPDISSDALPGA
jgi:hypothetical protein